MTRIEITAPKGFTHTPAQHCFLRFPAISLLDNHPFTIASVQRSIDSAKNKTSAEVDSPQALTFLVRTHAGFTHKLAAYCGSRPDSDALAWIDGPYGGIGRPVDRLYDTLVLIAGGGGISACLPWLLYVTDKVRGGAGNAVKIKRIVLVWAMKEAEHFLWAENELDEVAADGQSMVAIQMRFYITGNAEPAALTKPTEAGATEKDGDVVEPVTSEGRSSSPSDRITKFGEYTSGKPVMREVVRDLVGQGKTLIIGCGPEGLRADLANACAEEQVRVMKGETQELAMHLEVFGWWMSHM